MSKISSLEELKELQKKYYPFISVREKGQRIQELIQIRVQMGENGIKAGAKEIYQAFLEEREKYNLQSKTVVFQVDCSGDCENAPIVEVEKPNQEAVYFENVNIEKVSEILSKYLAENKDINGMIPLKQEEK